MRLMSQLIASAAVLALSIIPVHARPSPDDGQEGPGGTPKPPTGPVQIISNAQFTQMVQSGGLQPGGPRQLAEQHLRMLLQDLENQEEVREFLRKNPGLEGLEDQVNGKPRNPKVFPAAGGTYRTQVPNNLGVPTTIEFMGQPSKLAMLADSIRTLNDPAKQLALYQSFYMQYGNLYNRVCAVSTNPNNPTTIIGVSEPPDPCIQAPLPTSFVDPATLANASLSTIHGALANLGAQALNIIGIVPLPNGALTCALESGTSTVADNIVFGDQTGSAGCLTPSAGGILGNFNWVNKNLLSPVKEQGARGTCHIFASTSGMEELIARDTGCIVNLSEEDFMENEKLIWGPSYYGDGGDPGSDLGNAAANGYHFAYENQWDYNPSWSQPGPPAYEYQNSCTGYPYPSLEPGCSDSAPQAPQFCTLVNAGFVTLYVCGFAPASVPGTRSPYMSNGTTNLWNPSNKGLSFDLIILSLAFNNAVLLGFGASNDFEYGAPGGYITYDPADIADTKNYVGSHVVHVVGYVGNSDLASNPGTAGATPGAGGGYFIIKNSWGACFGDAGYYYMPVQYLEDTAWGVYNVSSESH